MLGKFKNSIAFGFTATVLLILIVGQGALWMWFLFVQKDRIEREVEHKASMTAAFLANVSAEAIINNNLPGLMRYTNVIITDEDIITVRVLDSEGKLLALANSTVTNAQDDRTQYPFMVPWKNSLDHHIMYEGKRLGTVELTYSGKRANEFIMDLLTVPPMVQALVFCLIIIAVYFMFQRMVGTPIALLSEHIEKITAGDLRVRVPEMQGNELGTIAEGLQYLVERFSATVKRLNTTYGHVDDMVQNINRTFENTSTLIKHQSVSIDAIAKSIKRANESQQHIIENTDQVAVFSNENVAALLQMKASADEIVTNMEELHGASEKSYSIVSEMSRTSEGMLDKTQDVLTSVENTSASVEEIMASVREVERNAKESSGLAEKVRDEAAHRGVVVVAEAIRKMEYISSHVQMAVDIVQRLEERSKDVQRILSVIKEINEQTNLLSLNAAILAEQAGEYGAGFSVVADEMRALSTRTATYTKDISSIIKTTIAEIKDVRSVIDNGMKRVVEGSAQVYDVGETMSSILESAHESANMAMLIARATEDQAKALLHIEESVIEINKMAFDMTTAMEGQTKNATFMLDRVSEVRETADSAMRSSSEQAKGIKVITGNIEVVSERVEGITQETIGQQKLGFDIQGAAEEIRSSGQHAIHETESVMNSLLKLHEEVLMLKQELARFRT